MTIFFEIVTESAIVERDDYDYVQTPYADEESYSDFDDIGDEIFNEW